MLGRTSWNTLASLCRNAKSTRDVAPLPFGGGVWGGVAPRTTTQLLAFLLLTLLPFFLTAQTKSAIPAPTQNSKLKTQNSTRAVVVGISDYQDDGIPDLKYADRDAEAFDRFLRSPAGGSLDDDHLKVLLNQQATQAQVVAALYWLLDECREGDQAIFYFSGHGDVEAKLVGQPGFLLCWDSPAKVYMAGALGVDMLQTVVSTLSTQNKVQVILITDACRAGKLAGSGANGPQLTNAGLAKTFANEIKILSCQPNEYSIEGEQWGGGRGAFSYHLLDGLYGFADVNTDQLVTLLEIGRYLEDRVTTETAPSSQVPMVVGNRSEKLADVHADLLAALRSGKTNQMTILSAIESRGLEDDVLAKADTSARELYRLFKKALQEKVLLEPQDACADAYFERLMQEPTLARLHAAMRRNYAAALQDDVQQALNAYLKADSLEMVHRYKNDPKYTIYPKYLKRAAELLGDGHYMYNALLARQLYFEGLCLRMQSTDFGKRDSLYRLALEKQTKALELEQYAPFVVQEIGQLNQYLRNYKQALASYEQAMQLVPKWTIPVMDASRLNSYFLYDHQKALEFARRALQIDSAGLDAHLTLARAFHYGGKVDSAEILYKQILKQWPNDYQSYWYAAMFYRTNENTAACKKVLAEGIERFPDKAILYFEMGRLYHFVTGSPGLAREYFYKSISLDSTNVTNHWLISQSYNWTGKPDSALAIALKGLAIRPNHTGLIGDIGRVYENYGDYENAEKYYKRAISVSPNWSYPYFRLGAIRKEQFHDYEAAKVYLLKSTKLSPWWGCTGLAEMYFMENKPDSALLVLERGSNAEPTWVEGNFHIGHVLWRHGYYEKAINQFKIILGFSPHSITGLSSIAQVYEIMGDLDSAILAARILIEYNPQYGGGYDQLSKFYRKRDMFDGAIALLREGIETIPGILLHHNLAETYWQKGDTIAALSEYKKVVEIGTQERGEKWMVCLANYRLGNPSPFDPCNLEEGSMDTKVLVAWSEHILYSNAALYAMVGDAEESLKWLKKAFDKGYKDYQIVLIDLDLKSLHDTPKFKALMKEYFPNHFKN